MPKEDDKVDKKKKNAPKKAPQRKKDEPPPKPIKWAGPPEKTPLQTVQLMQQAKKNIVENVFPSNSRGQSCHSGVAPVIIKEVFFPPVAPPEIATLIESALVYQNNA